MTNNMSIKTLAMMGYPGSGKGSQAKLLAEEFDFKIFSTGGEYREIAKENTIVGRKIKEIIESGYLTPHWFAAYLFQRAALGLSNEEGIIFEGVARKEGEARLFHTVMEWLERPYRVLFLNVDEEVAIKRLLGRAESEGRVDDGREKIKLRFNEFSKHTAPAIAYFRTVGVVVDINSEQTKKEVHREILEKLKNIG